MVSELSVLIPIYNYDVSSLVSALLAQCRELTSRFEICLYDDGSDEKIRQKHRLLNQHEEIRYVELRRNIGRAAIRNQLARDAKYQFLLFLDNDSALPDKLFIKRYWESPADAEVVIGGTIYEAELPAERNILRWKYGRAREEKSGEVRNKNPYQSLTLNNLLIRKLVCLKFPLNTDLTGYGHEDTKFGWELQKAGIKILHIDNPVIHLGLEPAADFIKKTKQGVRNLYRLYQSQETQPDSKLIRSYELLKKFGLRFVFYKSFQLMKDTVLENLLSPDPSLRYFDLYKLYLFTRQALKKR